MKTDELIKALGRLKVQTGSLACLGCGHEHNCGVHGCNLLREAVTQLIEQNGWINPKERLPERGERMRLFAEKRGTTMNKLTVAGILTTYAQKSRLARNTKQLRRLIRELRKELDLRKVRCEEEEHD